MVEHCFNCAGDPVPIDGCCACACHRLLPVVRLDYGEVVTAADLNEMAGQCLTETAKQVLKVGEVFGEMDEDGVWTFERGERTCVKCGRSGISPDYWDANKGACYMCLFKERGSSMRIFQELLSFDVDRVSLDDMVALSAFAKLVIAEYQANDLMVPERVREQMDVLNVEIGRRALDSLEKAAREIERREAMLKSREERRADVIAEKARITEKIAAVKAKRLSSE